MPTRPHLPFSSPASTWRRDLGTRGSATSSACAGSRRCISAAASRRPSALPKRCSSAPSCRSTRRPCWSSSCWRTPRSCDYRKALDTAVRALELLGEHIPGRPGTAQVMAELARTKLALAGRRMDSLRALPRMVDRAQARGDAHPDAGDRAGLLRGPEPAAAGLAAHGAAVGALRQRCPFGLWLCHVRDGPVRRAGRHAPRAGVRAAGAGRDRPVRRARHSRPRGDGVRWLHPALERPAGRHAALFRRRRERRPRGG